MALLLRVIYKWYYILYFKNKYWFYLIVSTGSSATSKSSSSFSSSTVPASLSASGFDVNSFRQLSELLKTIGFAHYIGNIALFYKRSCDILLKCWCFADLFMANEVDFTMFTTLNDADLVSIGINSLMIAIYGKCNYNLTWSTLAESDRFIIHLLRRRRSVCCLK